MDFKTEFDPEEEEFYRRLARVVGIFLTIGVASIVALLILAVTALARLV